MTITSIENSGNKHNRLSLYVDNQFCCTISQKDLNALNLTEKDDITDETISFIKDTINPNAAKACAINYLSYKLRTEKEVLDKLKTEGFDELSVENAVSELKSMGYINDRIYCQKYIYDRSKLRPASRRMLKYELRNKGISGALADSVLDEYAPDDASVAAQLAKKKFAKYDPNDEKTIKKMYTFLSNRGFSHDVIIFAISKMTD